MFLSATFSHPFFFFFFFFHFYWLFFFLNRLGSLSTSALLPFLAAAVPPWLSRRFPPSFWSNAVVSHPMFPPSCSSSAVVNHPRSSFPSLKSRSNQKSQLLSWEWPSRFYFYELGFLRLRISRLTFYEYNINKKKRSPSPKIPSYQWWLFFSLIAGWVVSTFSSFF